MGEPGRLRRRTTIPSRPRAVNTHVHLPPNFSAFDTVEAVVARAHDEGLVAVGGSNYSDFHVYRPFAEAAREAGLAALFGLEIIAVLDDLRSDGILVNDPGNPGRTYLCGKAITGFEEPSPIAAGLMAETRRASDERIVEMNDRLAGCFEAAGLAEPPTVAAITTAVAARNAVEPGWVALQERHLARAWQEAVFDRYAEGKRTAFLGRLLGDGFGDRDDAVATQEAIRSQLMKAGKPAFVPEAAVSFDDAYRLVVELGGIPCYPTLADGTDPICPFEDPPEALATGLLDRGIHVAELIPIRNSPTVLDRYVEAFRSAGILVLGGTEHNTQRMIPLDPACLGGAPLPEQVREAFWEGTCVVAAHQALGMQGQDGYVDRAGRLAAGFADDEARIRWFRELGEAEIAAAGRAAVA